MHTVLDCSLRGHWVYWEAGKQAAALHQWVEASLDMPDVIKHKAYVSASLVYIMHACLRQRLGFRPYICLFDWSWSLCHYIPCRVPPPRPAPGQDGVRFRVGSLYESVGYPA